MNIFQQVFANANSNKPAFNNNPSAQPPDLTQVLTTSKSKNETNVPRPVLKSNSSQPTTVSFDLKSIANVQNPKKEVINSSIDKKSSSISVNANNAIKKKKDSQIELSLKNKLEVIQKKVDDMEFRLKQKQQDLRSLKEKNEHLRLQKQEKEIYIEKMNAATDELNKKIIQMQDDYDQEDEEKKKYWEFRYMELKFQIETMKEESIQ